MQFGLKCSFPGPGRLSELTRREEGPSLSLLTRVTGALPKTRSTDGATTSSLLRAHYPSVIKEIGSDCTVTWYRWHRLPVCSCQAAWTTLRLEPATRMCSTRYPILFSRLEGHSRASRSFSFPRLHTVTAPGPQWGAACACTAREIHDARSAHWRIVLAGISRANLRPAAHAHSIACCARSCALRFCDRNRDRVMRAAGFVISADTHRSQHPIVWARCLWMGAKG